MIKFRVWFEESVLKKAHMVDWEELKEFKGLFTMAERLHKTNILRQYISSYEQFVIEQGEMDDEVSAHLQWAKEKADWLDPFISKEDKYLDKDNMDEILEPECPKLDSWKHNDISSSGYSFWSKPYYKRNR